MKYDSVFGRYAGDVGFDDKHLIVDGHSIRVTDQPDPLLCPWHAYGIDVAREATGRFTHREQAAQQLRAGASRGLVTAPAKYEDVTIAMGGNEQACHPERH